MSAAITISLAAAAVAVPLSGAFWLYGRVKRALSPGWEIATKGGPDRFATRIEDGKPEGEVKEYDIIIVGGGTAGSVLAGRLSSMLPASRILVLEAGPLTKPPLFSFIPATFPALIGNVKTDWGYETAPQPNCDDRTFPWPRGRMMGGCSAVNAMLVTHCAPSDYDEWGKGWTYDDLKPYFARSEELTPHPDWPLKPSWRSSSKGPMKISYPHYMPLSDAFTKACAKVGIDACGDLSANERGKGCVGVARSQAYIRDGMRVSAATAYLTPEILARDNLDIHVGAQVTRILFENEPGEEPRAVGVEFTPFLDSPEKVPVGKRPVYRVRATQQVILCGGTLNSPHLLKLSGVGPRDELERFEIPVVKDLPGVGEHLQDHLACSIISKAAKGTSLQFIMGAIAPLLTWLRTHQGPLVSNVCESYAFVSSQDLDLNKAVGLTPPELENNLAARPYGPDFEMMQSPLGFGPGMESKEMKKWTDYNSIGGVLLKPTSRGRVTLKSADPLVHVDIDPAYLSTEDDRRMAVWGIKLLSKIVQVDPLASLVGPCDLRPDGPKYPDDTDTDEDLLARMRKFTMTTFHPIGTVKMASEPSGGCVDNSLRVHGVSNLRVVDASIFPGQVSGHPSSPLIAISEKIADEIARELGSSPA